MITTKPLIIIANLIEGLLGTRCFKSFFIYLAHFTFTKSYDVRTFIIPNSTDMENKWAGKLPKMTQHVRGRGFEYIDGGALQPSLLNI